MTDCNARPLNSINLMVEMAQDDIPTALKSPQKLGVSERVNGSSSVSQPLTSLFLNVLDIHKHIIIS